MSHIWSLDLLQQLPYPPANEDRPNMVVSKDLLKN